MCAWLPRLGPARSLRRSLEFHPGAQPILLATCPPQVSRGQILREAKASESQTLLRQEQCRALFSPDPVSTGHIDEPCRPYSRENACPPFSDKQHRALTSCPEAFLYGMWIPPSCCRSLSPSAWRKGTGSCLAAAYSTSVILVFGCSVGFPVDKVCLFDGLSLIGNS